MYVLFGVRFGITIWHHAVYSLRVEQSYSLELHVGGHCIRAVIKYYIEYTNKRDGSICTSVHLSLQN